MKDWGKCPCGDVRPGNIIEWDGVMAEVTGKRPSGRAGNTNMFLDTKEHGPIELGRDEQIEVYR